MADTIPASEFTRNFGRYRMLAQREAVAVSSHGSITGYFLAPDEYEAFMRFKQRRHSFATAELSDEKVEAIGASQMDARHAHLEHARLMPDEIADARLRRLEAMKLQEIEGNPLNAEDIAMFEMFEHEGWPHEQRRAYIISKALGQAAK